MIFQFPRWDMLVPWRVGGYNFNNFSHPSISRSKALSRLSDRWFWNHSYGVFVRPPNFFKDEISTIQVSPEFFGAFRKYVLTLKQIVSES